jgi:hypothetical protein
LYNIPRTEIFGLNGNFEGREEESESESEGEGESESGSVNREAAVALRTAKIN